MRTKTIAEKLLTKPNTTVWSSHTGRLNLIDPLPEGVHPANGPAPAATALVFAGAAGSPRNIITAHTDHLAQPSTLWVAYPKANRAGINRDTLGRSWPNTACVRSGRWR